MRRRQGVCALAAAAVAVAVAAGAAWGQSSTSGAIAGIVTDQATGDPLPGVTVVVSSPSLQGVQSALTDGRGSYKIDSLPPGIYMVTFYIGDGQVQRRGIHVNLSRVTRVDQKLDVTAAGGEVVVVDAKAPTIDTTRTDEGITVDKDYLKHIPVPGRTFGAALGAAAGSAGDSRGVGFSGSTSLENSYVIDGVNTTGLSFGSIGTDLINEFIEEIQVLTGGYQAEFGRATGAVVNVITKSGSNEFHGSVFSTITPYVRPRERIFQVTSAIDSDIKLDYQADFGVELGGPIVKDRVWFYVGFAPRFVRNNVARIVKSRRDCQLPLEDGSLTPCSPDNADGQPDEDPTTGLLLFEEVDRDEFKTLAQSYQFVSKVSFALTPEHQGSLSILGTPTSGEGIFGVFGTRNATRADFTSLNTDVAARWTSKFNDNKTQVEGLFGWHRDKYDQDAIDQSLNDVPTIRVFLANLGEYGRAGQESQRVLAGCTDGVSTDKYPQIENCPVFQYWLDSPGFIIDNLEDRKSGQIKLTQRAQLAGHHEIKVGADVENNLTRDVRKLNGGVFYQHIPDSSYLQNRIYRYVRALGDDQLADVCGFQTDERGQVIVDENGNFVPNNCEYLTESPVTGNTFNWAAFAQDSWSLQPNLTLNYGVRYEEQRLRYAEHLRGTIDPFTDEPLGKNALTLRNMWAPRFGVIYDWTKEGRSKLYASWGRFYESIPMTINDFSFSGDALYGAFWQFSQCTSGNRGQWKDPNLAAPHPANCPERVTQEERPGDGDVYRGGVTLVTPGTKAQYLDEAVVGVQYELLEDLRLGLAYKRRSLGRVIEDVSIDAADTYIVANPGPDGFPEAEEAALEAQIAALDPDDPDRARLEQRLEQFRAVRTFDKPRRVYNALEFTAIKRFSRNFYVQGSYTLSRTEGNYPGLLNEDNGAALPNISTQYDLIELLPNRDGPLPQDRTHYIKFDGYYLWDLREAGEVTAGVRFRAFSGTPIDVLGAHYLYGFNESYLLPRGYFGRTEFVTGTDLHFSYGRKLAYGYDVSAFVDIFNLFNQEQTAAVDEAYTLDNANPIVGGRYEDLVYLKAADLAEGTPTTDPVTRNLNFGNPVARYASQSIRFGLRVTF